MTFWTLFSRRVEAQIPLPVKEKSVLQNILNNQYVSHKRVLEFKMYLQKAINGSSSTSQRMILIVLFVIIVNYLLWKQRQKHIRHMQTFVKQCQTFYDASFTPKRKSLIENHLHECETFMLSENASVILHMKHLENYCDLLRGALKAVKKMKKVREMNLEVQTEFENQIYLLSWSERFTDYLSEIKYKIGKAVSSR